MVLAAAVGVRRARKDKDLGQYGKKRVEEDFLPLARRRSKGGHKNVLQQKKGTYFF